MKQGNRPPTPGDTCIHCGKQRGDHKAATLHCPAGTKTRIGYTCYSGSLTFTPKEGDTR